MPQISHLPFLIISLPKTQKIPTTISSNPKYLRYNTKSLFLQPICVRNAIGLNLPSITLPPFTSECVTTAPKTAQTGAFCGHYSLLWHKCSNFRQTFAAHLWWHSPQSRPSNSRHTPQNLFEYFVTLITATVAVFPILNLKIG